jgi:hypothetical protein
MKRNLIYRAVLAQGALYNMNETSNYKWKYISFTRNMGRAIGVGIVTSPEVYLYINIYTHNLAIGFMKEYTYE